MAVEDIVIGTRVDTSGLKKGLKTVTTSVAKGSKGIAAMGGSIAKLAGPAGVATAAIVGLSGAVMKLAGATAEIADETGKASQRLGVSIETYQKLQSAANHAGASMTTMATGMRTMLRQMTAVSEGNKRATESFEELGVAVFGSNGEMRDQEDVFNESLVALSKMSNEAERNALAQKLLGRSASELGPLFNEGADAVERYLVANESAVVVSNELAQSSARYNDAMQTVGESLRKAKNDALEPFMETMADLAEAFLSSTWMDDMANGFNTVKSVVIGIDNALRSVNAGINQLEIDRLQKLKKGVKDIAPTKATTGYAYGGGSYDIPASAGITAAEQIAQIDKLIAVQQEKIDKIYKRQVVSLEKITIEKRKQANTTSNSSASPASSTSSSDPAQAVEQTIRGIDLSELLELSLNSDMEDKAQERIDGIINITLEGMNAISSVMSSASDLSISRDESELSSWKKKEQGKLDATRMSDRRRAQAQKKLDAEEEKRQKEIDKKRAQARVREMWAQTAMGITGAWAQAFATNAPAWAPIVAGISTAALVTNASIQTADAMQGFEDGGVVMGNSMTGDRLGVNVNSAEAVFNDRQFKDLIDFVKPENGGNGVTIVVENLSGSDDDLDRLEDRLLQLQSNGRINREVFA